MYGPPVVAIAVVLWLAFSWAGAAFAQPEETGPPPDLPMLFKADEMSHDRELGIVVARGNVEITYESRILMADTVSYNQRADLVTATGNVTMLEPTGEVLFADHAEITGDLKEGVIANIRVRMADNARFAAAGGRLTSGNVTRMSKAVYSPCLPCRDQPDRALPWQLKANTVTHDRAKQIVEYEDAFLELYGVPIAYTPYLSHPDPTVKRKTGLLAPRYGRESTLGFLTEIPYYFAIGPDRDATFAPVITSEQGVVIAGEYRQRFVDGALRVHASGTRSQPDDGAPTKNRGHFFGNLRFDIDDTWRTGADVQVSSDDTYLRRYRYSTEDTLTSRAFVEGFRGRNYTVAQAYHWRGLKTDDDPGQTPILAPQLHYSFVGEPGASGGRWSFDADMMVLTRTDGTDSRRLSAVTGWSLPHVARTGEVYNLYATVQTDGYWVDQVQEPGRASGDLSSGTAGRIFPRVGVDWRWPFAQFGAQTTRVIEPVAGIVLAPNGGNPGKIPNEDSRDFEFDDTNLLSPNRFGGLDRIEGGHRVYYGLNAGLYGPGTAFASMFIGQSYRFRHDDTFDVGSGLADQFSDLVGRVQIQPNAPLNVLYRFRLDKDNLAPRRNEVTLSAGPRALNISVGYVFVDRIGGAGEFAAREEITAGISSRLTPEWTIGGSTRRDLGDDGGALANNMFLTYSNDCLTVRLDFQRTFTIDRDIKPSDAILLRLVFKNLGEVQSRVGP